jgi:hypothetical protein
MSQFKDIVASFLEMYDSLEEVSSTMVEEYQENEEVDMESLDKQLDLIVKVNKCRESMEQVLKEYNTSEHNKEDKKVNDD